MAFHVCVSDISAKFAVTIVVFVVVAGRLHALMNVPATAENYRMSGLSPSRLIVMQYGWNTGT